MSGETGSSESGWTTDTLHVHMQRQLDGLTRMLDERYATQTKATDKAFEAQQTAMQAALTAAETAVSKALESAEKAVTKAESAAEKRFDAVNEFRGQLSDQAATLMPRAESNARHEAAAEKIDALNTRLDKAEGRGTGLNAGWIYLLGAIAAIGTIVSFYLAMRGG